MKGLVYVLFERARKVVSVLEKAGFECVVGNGTFDDEILAKCWALVPGRGRVTKEILDKAPNLKLISKEGVGVERINVDECTKRGICVANTPASNYISVAEHTIALILNVAKQIYPLARNLKKDNPEYPGAGANQSVELYGKTISLIGFGRIGARVALLAHAFGMQVIVYTTHPTNHIFPDYVKVADSIDDALAAGDVVSAHVSGVEKNRDMFSEHEFSVMKKNAIFINTTRGLVVDEEALYEALVNEKILGAGLDVFKDEPVLPENKLLSLDCVVGTPHTAANTKESRIRAGEECAKSILEFADGQWPEYAVNKISG